MQTICVGYMHINGLHSGVSIV